MSFKEFWNSLPPFTRYCFIMGTICFMLPGFIKLLALLFSR